MKSTIETTAPRRKRKFIGCSLLDHFELGQKVGVGTFGEVVKAKHLQNGKNVALKKIFTKSEQEGFPITSLREIKLLKNVSHLNVASLIDMAVSYKNEGEFKEIEDVYMVFPFMDHDLNGILENDSIKLTLPQIKCYMKQMLEGISYLHSRQIMHRDLKGANLLVNNRGELKITDFGLARPLEENRNKYTPGVVTRWYRPPELLFGSDIYDESIDIWGLGCIIAEMYLRRPLFGAESDLDQIKLLCCYCGTPNEETYPGVGKLPDFSKIQLKPEKRILREYLGSKNLDKEAIDLIDSMLVMDPKKRISAKIALEHKYFTTDPLPCLPSEIEKFESSHVYTVQQQKKKEKEMNKRSRELEDGNNQSSSKRHSSRHYDYDSRPSGHYNSQHRLRYNEKVSSPPPPPPPPLPVAHAELDSHRDHGRGSNLRNERETHARREYRDYDDNKVREYDEYDDRNEHHRSEHHRNEHYRNENYRNEHYEHRRIIQTQSRESNFEKSDNEATIPSERRISSTNSNASTERNRRTISYDDL